MIYVGIALSIVILEWVIKGYIEKNKEEDGVEERCKGLLRIQKYHNRGAFLNIMEKNGLLVRILSVLLTLLILVLFIVTLGKAGNTLLKTGLSLLLGGAFSNTYDRLYRKYVVDYFSFHIPKCKKLSAVVFNIADFCIIVGAMFAVTALS